MPKTIRTFIAIDPTPAIQTELAATGKALARRFDSAAVRWQKPEKMHLTLIFLGDTPRARIGDISLALDEAAAGHYRFQLALTSVGCFPTCRRPRVIWVGLGGDVEPLRTFQRSLSAALELLGWPPEKRAYHPHLTLGRVRKGARVMDVPAEAVKPAGHFDVTAVHLYESHLHPDGARYAIRHTSLLAGAAP